MRRILVVDDQPAVRRLLYHLFTSAGYRVTEAKDGREALESCQADPPDLCVLDVMMPEVDGWGVLRQLRAEPVTAELPVVMLTAKGRSQDRLMGWELGCDAYIPKPFDPPECLNEVLAVMARSPDERAAMRQRQLSVVRSMVVGDRRAG